MSDKTKFEKKQDFETKLLFKQMTAYFDSFLSKYRSGLGKVIVNNTALLLCKKNGNLLLIINHLVHY